jgi:hypothetical protein
MTPDSVFAIASNSKLFLAMSVGLLVFNKTLAEERGQEIKWSTKIRDLIPEWGLMDEEMDRGVSLQDMLSHRTGMPRHDFSGIQRKGGVSEMALEFSVWQQNLDSYCFSDVCSQGTQLFQSWLNTEIRGLGRTLCMLHKFQQYSDASKQFF